MKSFLFLSALYGLTTLSVLVSAIPTNFSSAASPYAVGNLETRQAGAIVEAAAEVVNIVGDIVSSIKDAVAQDKLKREQFTQSVVDSGCSKKPQFNWIICHTKHQTKFDGKQGVDWDHSHQEVDIKVGGTIGYEIYWLKTGVFTRQGDGGFMNWAMCGNFKRTGNQDSIVTFTKR